MGLLVAGNNPAAVKSAERSTFNATAGQTTFTFTSGYQVGDIDVYLNGIKLVDTDDYIANNGSTIVLTSAAVAGDVLTVISFNQFNVANSFTKTETDARYLPIGGGVNATSYIRTPNYGISSYSDTANASLEANPGLGTQGVAVKAWGRSIPTWGGDVHYISDTRGASGAHRFYGWNGTSWTENLKIDASGRVNIPNQPAFFAYGSGIMTSAGYITFASTRVNVGGYYNTSTGRFTAPVSGNYSFTLHTLHRGNNTSGNAETTIYKNGSNIGSRGFAYSTNSSSNGHTPMQFTLIVPLLAGEWVQPYAHTIAASSDIYLQEGLSHFSGYLIG